MIYRFGDIELDTTLFELRAGGAVTAVEPQVFDVLRYLVVNRDRLVTKEELLDNVWGDRFVSESALTTRIKTARRAVGDDGQSQQIVRTVHGRGYRFVAPVEEIEQVAIDMPAPAAPAPPREPPATSPAANVFIERRSGADARCRAWPLLGRAGEIEAVGRGLQRSRDWRHPLHGRRRRRKDAARRRVLAVWRPTPASRSHGSRAIPRRSECRSRRCRISCRPTSRIVAGPEGELERGLLFHRARTALEQIGDGRRWVVMADDVNHLDELSARAARVARARPHRVRRVHPAYRRRHSAR